MCCVIKDGLNPFTEALTSHQPAAEARATRRPNARVRRNHTGGTLDLLALTAIAAGREITIDYNCPLWFAAAE